MNFLNWGMLAVALVVGGTRILSTYPSNGCLRLGGLIWGHPVVHLPAMNYLTDRRLISYRRLSVVILSRKIISSNYVAVPIG